MGQGSSQPADYTQNEDFQNNVNAHVTRPYSSPSTTAKDANPTPQQGDGTPVKRKRKSSHSVASPLTVPSTERPNNAAKRKRLVDALETGDTPTADRNSQPKVSDSQSLSIKREQSAAVSGDDKTSSTPPNRMGKSYVKRRRNQQDKPPLKGRTGPFEKEEVEALEDFKVRFCNTNRCPPITFDLIVQSGCKRPCPSVNGITKHVFFREARNILPDRERKSIHRFMKRHFYASDQKPHEWTTEQEDELVALYQQYGSKWTQFAQMLGRGTDDVVQKWKNHLEHRDTMVRGYWSDDEIRLLKKIVRSAWSKMKAEGYNVGESMYEMDEKLVAWGQVSNAMQNTRSRQQCADRWRRLKAFMGEPKLNRMEKEALKGSPSPFPEPPVKFRKSTRFVDSEDDDVSDAPENDADGRAGKSTPGWSTDKIPGSPANGKLRASNEPTNVKSSEDEFISSSSSDDSDSSSDSSSESESESSTSDKKPKTASNSAKLNGLGKKISSQNEEPSSTSSSSDSASSSDSDSYSDSESKSGDQSRPPAQELEVSKAARTLKDEFSSNDSSDSSSSDESESENESESESNKVGAAKNSSTPKDASKNSKRKREESPAHETQAQDDKRVKVKKEPSPTPSIASSSKSDSDSESDGGSASNIRRKATAARKDSSRETETSSVFESSESSAGKVSTIKNFLDKQSTELRNVSRGSDPPPGSTSSSDSDATSSSGSEDDVKGMKIDEVPERGGEAHVSKQKNKAPEDNDASSTSDSDFSSDETSSSGSDSDSDSDSE